MSSTLLHSQTQTICRTRWERNAATSLLTIPTQASQLNGWWDQISPRRLPPTPKIRTVNLPTSSPTSGLSLDTPRDSRRSPSYFTCKPTPPVKPRAGPFQVVRQLRSGTYGTAVVAKDAFTKGRIFLKVIDKSRVQNEDRALQALRTELEAYKLIANCQQTSFVMDCYGVFQDESMIFFAMVSQFHMHSRRVT
jgi:hypothetical protein